MRGSLFRPGRGGAGRTPARASQQAVTLGWAHAGRWMLWLGVPIIAALAASHHRRSLQEAGALIARAQPAWLVAGAAAIAGLYACRAVVYGRPLRRLGYTIPLGFLWRIALIATTLHQLIPTAGASGYAAIAYGLHQRGVAVGDASLIALLDTLTCAVSVGTLVMLGLLGMLMSGRVALGSMLPGLLPGLVLLGLGVAAYLLQRDEARLRRIVVAALRWLRARGLGRWPTAPATSFLSRYAEAKRILARRPGVFVRMVAWQYVAVSCDGLALYAAFLALGLAPPPVAVGLGLIAAMAGSAVVSVPIGGGSFEVVMATVLAGQGVAPAQSVAATILYRALAFWLPLLVTLGFGWALRRRRRLIRRTPRSRAHRIVTHPRSAR